MINSSIAEIHALFIHFFTKKLFDWFKNTNQDKNFKYKISVKVIQMQIFMMDIIFFIYSIKLNTIIHGGTSETIMKTSTFTCLYTVRSGSITTPIQESLFKKCIQF